ncbi:MAG: hypothetical protein Q4F05_12620 [bacterium]|nr:hypothetical protein [bacterium]
MDEESIKLAKAYFQTMEEDVGKLSQKEQAKVFRTCGRNCVKGYVLPELRKWLEQSNGDMDLMYEQHADSEYSFYRVIEKGHVYEMGYPKCLCYMYELGFANSEVHCECSRQSIIYALQELFPHKKFQVTTMHTVLGGAKECRFRIEVE